MKILRVLLVAAILLGGMGFAAMYVGGSSPARVLSTVGERLGMSASTSSSGSAPSRDGAQAGSVRIETAGLGTEARRFYERRAQRPAWFDGDRLKPEANTLLDAVRRAPEEGLDAADYELDAIQQVVASGAPTESPRRDPAQIARLDVGLTNLFLHYASDVAIGRVDPRGLHPDWHLAPNEMDLPQLLGDALEAGRLPQLLAELPPPQADYARLRQALAALRSEAAPVASPARASAVALDRNKSGARRKRIAAAPAPPPLPVAQRIRRVMLSMERWRWVPRKLGDTYILINIPAFTLDVREGDRSALQMRIVAGKNFTPTPVFSDTVTALVFNPAWNIPEGIARDEVLTAALHDPAYLKSKGIHAVSDYGEHAREFDSEAIRASASKDKLPFVFRQDPGPENPLGRIKFLMPNKYDIYLHDTPADHLFARAERAFSHGCIRVEKPIELAEYLLRGTEWDRSRIMSAMEDDETQEVPLPRTVPVHIVYMTAWAGESGVPAFGDDIYELDGILDAMLHRSRQERASVTPADAPSAATGRP